MPRIIAECCQNHLGDWSVLKDMVWAAADAGADIVKIQSMRAQDVSHRDRFEEGVMDGDVRRSIRRPYQAEFERMRTLELSDDAHGRFIEECGKAGVESMTTAFSRNRIPFLASLPWRRIKVASYDCCSLPMLETLVDRFDEIIVSTGATYDHEIAAAAKILGRRRFAFLHCVTVYPTPLDQLALGRMAWLRQFTGTVGFSDHTLTARDGNTASFAALALGADIIERHFTVLAADKTKDGPVSIGPGMLRELVQFSQRSLDDQRQIVSGLVGDLAPLIGQADRKLSPEEELNRDYYRGRFASHVGGEVIDNWDPRPIDGSNS